MSDTTVPEERMQSDGFSVTESESEVLFTHYLEMAGCFFETLPGDYELPSDRFSDPLKKAAEAFYNILQEEYTKLGAMYDQAEDMTK